MRTIVFFLLIFAICCKGPSSNTRESGSIVRNFKIDTLVSDNYNWQYFVTPDEDVYFLKEENTVYLNKRKIGQISLIFEAERFLVTNDYIAIEYVDSNALSLVNIYNHIDLSLANRIINSHLIDVLFEDNRIIIDKEDKNNLEVYDITTDSTIFMFSKGENYPIITSQTIFVYDAMFLKNKENNLIISAYERSTFNRIQDVTISNPKERLILSFFNEKYIAEEDEKLYFVNFQGNNIKEWRLPANSDFQMISDRSYFSFYYWMKTSDKESGNYFLLRQKIPWQWD